MEKKFLLPLLPGLEPATFRSRVRRSTSTTELFLSLIVPRDVVTEEVLPQVTLCDTDRMLKFSK